MKKEIIVLAGLLMVCLTASTGSALAAAPMPALPFDGQVAAGIDHSGFPGDQPEVQQIISKDTPDTRAYGIAGAADRMLETQCPALCGGKGWGWPIDCPPPESVPGNTLGPAGIGLLKGYEQTDDIDHLIGAFEAGDYAKCYTYPTGQFRFGSFTPYFLWYISEVIPSAVSYRDHADLSYFQALEDGTFGPPASGSCPECPYDTSELLTSMWNYRNVEYGNLRIYDSVVLPKAALELGSTAQYGQYLTHISNAVNYLDRSKYWDVQGLACGIASIAMMNEDIDPVSGDFAHLDSIWEMADELLRYQYADGGFLWSTQFVDPYQKAIWTLGTGEWYSGGANWLNTALTKHVAIGTTTSFSFSRKNSIRTSSGDLDICYVEYSTNGTTWNSFPGLESGIGGCQITYITETSSFPALGSYWVRFRYQTDSYLQGMGGSCSGMNPGMYVDDISIDGVVDPCDDANGWIASNESYGVLPTANDQSAQDTAYALIALKTADLWVYEDQIDAAEDFLLSVQMANGGFESYPGTGSENSQVNGEVIWALVYQPECFNDGDVDDNGMLTPQDAQLAFQFYLGTFPVTPTYHDFCSSDCNGSGSVTPADGLCIWNHYLSSSCYCEDELPAKKGPAFHRCLNSVSNGVIACTTQYHLETHELIMTITASGFEAPLDALGMTVTHDSSLRFHSVEFSGPVKDWLLKAAEAINDNTVLIGACDPSLYVPPGQTIEIAKLVFRNLSPDSYGPGSIQVIDLVDDIQYFNIQRPSGSLEPIR